MKCLSLVAAAILLAAPAASDPLPSWTGTDTKDAIVAFVEAVTDPAADSYVPPADRIAVFDNDGTLWAEQPLYFQALFAFDKLREAAEADPGVLSTDARRAAAEGDLETLMAGGVEALLDVIDVSHSGMSVEDFQDGARDWLARATHPTTGLPFTQMTYQPMLELLRYLRDEGFRTYIVSGGGVDFIRALSEDAYGIPPSQVVGTEGNTAYAVIDGVPTLTKTGGVSFVDDKEGKPVGIIRHIGQRPIFAAGNSDGDFQMLEWTTAGEGPRFGLLVHHTDAAREWAYDRDSHIGRLARGLDEAESRGWVVVDMAEDWSRVWSAP